MVCRFRDGCGLQFILTTQMEDLMKSQKTVQEAVKSLEGPASKKVIDEATVCHLRPMRLPLNKYDISVVWLRQSRLLIFFLLTRHPLVIFQLCFLQSGRTLHRL